MRNEAAAPAGKFHGDATPPPRLIRSPQPQRLGRRLCAGLCLAVFGGSFLHADPVETAIVAAMKLPAAPNYAWVTDIVDDARTYSIAGKTERAGDFSRVTMPMISVLRRRAGLGAGNSDNQVTAIFCGDQRLVVDVDGTWKTPAEMSASSRMAGRRAGNASGGTGGARIGGRNPNDKAALPPYSNLQLTLSRPHDEIAIIVANASEWRAEPDGVSGALADLGARLLLVHPGQNELTPLRAGGTFRLWLKEGSLVRYQVRLTGTLAVKAGLDRREIDVNQDATTKLREMGTTRVDVPEEAKRKLVP